MSGIPGKMLMIEVEKYLLFTDIHASKGKQYRTIKCRWGNLTCEGYHDQIQVSCPTGENLYV